MSSLGITEIEHRLQELLDSVEGIEVVVSKSDLKTLLQIAASRTDSLNSMHGVTLSLTRRLEAALGGFRPGHLPGDIPDDWEYVPLGAEKSMDRCGKCSDEEVWSRVSYPTKERCRREYHCRNCGRRWMVESSFEVTID